MIAAAEYCVFSYKYRDAANYKSSGEVLLAGFYSPGTLELIRQQCDMHTFFIAEQVGLPTLYADLYQISDGPTSADVAFHEFECICAATPNHIGTTRLWGTVDELVARFRGIKDWDCRLSPHRW